MKFAARTALQMPTQLAVCMTMLAWRTSCATTTPPPASTGPSRSSGPFAHAAGGESAASADAGVPTSLARLRYVHIPKTGGSSVEEFGRAHLNASWGRYDDRWRPRRGPNTNDKCRVSSCSPWHVPPHANASSGSAATSSGVTTTTFCSLRHPADRLVAQYHHDAAVDAYCDEAAFRAWTATSLREFRTCPGLRDCHFVPQSEYAQHCAVHVRLESLARDLASNMSAVSNTHHATRSRFFLLERLLCAGRCSAALLWKTAGA